MDSFFILYYFIQALRQESYIKSKEDLHSFQKKKLDAFLKRILPKSQFYSEFKNTDFQDIPIIDKKIMMKNFDEINTCGIKLDEAMDFAHQAQVTRDFKPSMENITIGLSSGTSNQNGIFLVSQQERCKWVGVLLAKTLTLELVKFNLKIALFLRANSNLYTSLNKSLIIQFGFFDIMKSFQDNLEELSDYKPDVLTAPASILVKIAQAQEQAKINIAPKKIFSAAEVLEQKERLYIEDIFKIRIDEIYQCTEGFLGVTAKNKKLYLNEDYIYIEKKWIDKQSGRFTPIITDFSRTTQPIIRYRLDDILIEDFTDTTPYTCLKAIEGRCDDIFYFGSLNGNELVPIFPDILRELINSLHFIIFEYKIIQRSLQTIHVQIPKELLSVFKKEFIPSLENVCKEQKCKMPLVLIENLQHTYDHKKMRRIVRDFSIDQGLAI